MPLIFYPMNIDLAFSIKRSAEYTLVSKGHNF